MDTGEARTILSQQLNTWRDRSWSELRAAVGVPEASEVRGSSGASYSVEVEAFWDGEVEGNIRVVASIDDGGWRSLKPLCDDFIKAPGGNFVDE